MVTVDVKEQEKNISYLLPEQCTKLGNIRVSSRSLTHVFTTVCFSILDCCQTAIFLRLVGKSA